MIPGPIPTFRIVPTALGHDYVDNDDQILQRRLRSVETLVFGDGATSSFRNAEFDQAVELDNFTNNTFFINNSLMNVRAVQYKVVEGEGPVDVYLSVNGVRPCGEDATSIPDDGEYHEVLFTEVENIYANSTIALTTTSLSGVLVRLVQ